MIAIRIGNKSLLLFVSDRFFVLQMNEFFLFRVDLDGRRAAIPIALYIFGFIFWAD